jgi:hypothetical protein
MNKIAHLLLLCLAFGVGFGLAKVPLKTRSAAEIRDATIRSRRYRPSGPHAHLVSIQDTEDGIGSEDDQYNAFFDQDQFADYELFLDQNQFEDYESFFNQDHSEFGAFFGDESQE